MLTLADGSEGFPDLDAVPAQAQSMGSGGVAPTGRRCIGKVTPASLKKINTAHALVWRQVWSGHAAACDVGSRESPGPDWVRWFRHEAPRPWTHPQERSAQVTQW